MTADDRSKKRESDKLRKSRECSHTFIKRRAIHRETHTYMKRFRTDSKTGNGLEDQMPFIAGNLNEMAYFTCQ